MRDGTGEVVRFAHGGDFILDMLDWLDNVTAAMVSRRPIASLLHGPLGRKSIAAVAQLSLPRSVDGRQPAEYQLRTASRTV
jgi:hypothetical protein